MFHRRTYHLKARKRLDRPPAFVLSKGSKEFHLFRLLLDDHKLFFNHNALCSLAASRFYKLFLCVACVAIMSITPATSTTLSPIKRLLKCGGNFKIISSKIQFKISKTYLEAYVNARSKRPNHLGRYLHWVINYI